MNCHYCEEGYGAYYCGSCGEYVCDDCYAKFYGVCLSCLEIWRDDFVADEKYDRWREEGCCR